MLTNFDEIKAHRVTIIMSWKICVLSEMEIVKDVRKFAEYIVRSESAWILKSTLMMS